MSNIYLLSLHYHQPSQAFAPASGLFGEASKGGQIIVRAGYFGLCAQDGERGAWVCASGAFGLNAAFANNKIDPLNAIAIAANFKDDVIFPGLL